MISSTPATPSRARRRVAAVLASLAMGAVIVVACSSPNQPPLETSVGGSSSSGPAGGSSSGVVEQDSGPGADGGGGDATLTDGGERDAADATAPTESGLTQAFDASNFPRDARAGTPDAGCGFLNCPGCCDTNGVCLAGDASTACGSSGNQCLDCTLDGGTCEQPVCHH